MPTSSASSRLLMSRAVSLVPRAAPAAAVPASGEVLTPMVMLMVGSSMVMTGRGRGSSGSARVSPIMISAIPATAMMSPGPGPVRRGVDPVQRLGDVHLGQADPLDGAVVAAPGHARRPS